MHGPMGESFYTKSVSALVDSIQGNAESRSSLFEQAEKYFAEVEQMNAISDELDNQVKTLSTSLELTKKKLQKPALEKLNAAKRALKQHQVKQEKARSQRLQQVTEVVTKLVLLCESTNWEKTQVNSAKLLGTLQLVCAGQGNKLAKQSQKFKPIYKAVLALRLMDKLLEDKHVKNKHIMSYYKASDRYCVSDNELSAFQNQVVIPLVSAAIFQDVGLFHPEAQRILKGKDGGLDEFRVLDQEQRLALLKINYDQSLNYVTYGLGLESYVGNNKEERERFKKNQIERMKFVRTMLVHSPKPKQGIGNLIKIPQIYASFIFSTKQDANFMDSPKAGLLIMKTAKRNAVSKTAAKALLSIVGHFPQGYGVTYIPRTDNEYSDQYEYAVVVGLNPADPFEPICRAATKNLKFIPNGQMLTVDRHSNLYFPQVKKQLEKISPERLEEILRNLVSNFDERRNLALIPSYWEPYDFFCYTKFQNLWKQAY